MCFIHYFNLIQTSKIELRDEDLCRTCVKEGIRCLYLLCLCCPHIQPTRRHTTIPYLRWPCEWLILRRSEWGYPSFTCTRMKVASARSSRHSSAISRRNVLKWNLTDDLLEISLFSLTHFLLTPCAVEKVFFRGQTFEVDGLSPFEALSNAFWRYQHNLKTNCSRHSQLGSPM